MDGMRSEEGMVTSWTHQASTKGDLYVRKPFVDLIEPFDDG